MKDTVLRQKRLGDGNSSSSKGVNGGPVIGGGHHNIVCMSTIKNWHDAKLFTVKNTCNQINNMNLPENNVKRSKLIEH